MLVGFCLAYLMLFGDRILYTKTYSNLSAALPVGSDLWLLCVMAMAVILLSTHALAPRTISGALGAMASSHRLRVLTRLVGVFLALAGLTTVVLALTARSPKLISALATTQILLIVIFTSAFGLLALAFTVLPRTFVQVGKLKALHWRVVSGIMALAFISLSMMGTEAMLAPRESNQNIIEYEVPPNPTHSISAIIANEPRSLKPDRATRLELLFRLTKYNPSETAKRYPISLDSTHSYAISPVFRAVGLEVSGPPPELLQPHKCAVDELVRWDWIVSAPNETGGTIQTISIDLLLHDLTTGELAFSSPVASLNLCVQTPLGLPAWLISPGVTVGTLLSGLLALLWPVVSSRIVLAREHNGRKSKIITRGENVD